MAGIQRTATGAWRGDLRGGEGRIDSPSGVLHETPFTYLTRFENAKGTNPEELIAAAHAACYSMAFANYLSRRGHVPEVIETQATITLDQGSINKMHLATRGRVPGVNGQISGSSRTRPKSSVRCRICSATDWKSPWKPP